VLFRSKSIKITYNLPILPPPPPPPPCKVNPVDGICFYNEDNIQKRYCNDFCQSQKKQLDIMNADQRDAFEREQQRIKAFWANEKAHGRQVFDDLAK
jgi:hypothetical protein